MRSVNSTDQPKKTEVREKSMKRVSSRPTLPPSFCLFALNLVLAVIFSVFPATAHLSENGVIRTGATNESRRLTTGSLKIENIWVSDRSLGAQDVEYIFTVSSSGPAIPDSDASDSQSHGYYLFSLSLVTILSSQESCGTLLMVVLIQKMRSL